MTYQLIYHVQLYLLYNDEEEGGNIHRHNLNGNSNIFFAFILGGAYNTYRSIIIGVFIIIFSLNHLTPIPNILSYTLVSLGIIDKLGINLTQTILLKFHGGGFTTIAYTLWSSLDILYYHYLNPLWLPFMVIATSS